jgi:hypothetical protein
MDGIQRFEGLNMMFSLNGVFLNKSGRGPARFFGPVPDAVQAGSVQGSDVQIVPSEPEPDAL